MDLMIALGHVTAVIDVRRNVDLKVFSRSERADLSRISGSGIADRHVRGIIRIGASTAARIENPDAHTVTIRRQAAGVTVAFATVFDIHTEDSFDRLVTLREGVIAHAREAELVGRSAPRFRTADTIARVAEISDHSGGAR